MVIQKPVYEVLPYVYIVIGILVVIALDSPLTYLSGALFYTAGSAVWVMRSAYRRKNSRKEVSNRQGRVLFPEKVYEYLPFFYIAVGIMLVVTFDTWLAYLPGGILCMAGMLVWMIRAIYRSQAIYESVA
ncbi:MAG: hypothetical protein OQK12_03455 [Motiliproteus sp.]|nr:hypothetical protein [Motiliproteus sp.]MCW9050693.1 hypothetical protein [Motiliproteus sp.]